jgi:hypothetical protein
MADQKTENRLAMIEGTLDNIVNRLEKLESIAKERLEEEDGQGLQAEEDDE